MASTIRSACRVLLSVLPTMPPIPEAVISGTVFLDADSDGALGGGETGMLDWAVFIDADNDGLLDAGERSVLTSATGAYSFTGLVPGTYRVAALPRDRWLLSSAVAALTVNSGQAAVCDIGVIPAVPFDVVSGPIGPETRVNTTTAGDQSGASVASAANGNYVVAWHSSPNIYAQRYNGDGVPQGGQFQVNITSDANYPWVACDCDAAGSSTVVWRTTVGVFFRRFAADGAPLTGEIRIDEAAGVNRYYDPFSLATNASGQSVVAWQKQDQDGSKAGVFARRFDASGTPIGNEFRLSQYAFSDQSLPVVAIDDAGNITAAWLSKHCGGGNRAAYVRRFDAAGNPLGPETLLTPQATHAQFVRVATNGAGEVVVFYDKRFQRYHANGTPLGPEVAPGRETAH